jgi:hypothetical protein
MKPPVRITRKTSRPSLVRQLRPRAGMPIPKNRTKARVVPPVVCQRIPGRAGNARELLVAAVVEIVRVAMPAAALVMLTGLVEPKLSVGRSWTPAGLEVTAAVRATLPVKPPPGVTVIVEALPMVAPGLTDTALPPRVKLGVAVTVTELVPVAVL